jgi:hypothetical protein
MLPSPLKLELNGMVTKSVDGGLKSREENRGEVVSRVKTARGLLSEVLRDLEAGRTDVGLVLRAVGLELATMPVKLNGKRLVR